MRMIRPIPILLVFMLTLLVSFPLAGCRSGAKARQNVLVPAIELTSAGFKSDVDFGIASLEEDLRPDAQAAANQYFNAVASGDLRTIRVDAVTIWPVIKSLALSGIDAKVAENWIGPLGAESHFERVQNIENALNKTTGALGG